jgi:hypothetical protein
MAALLSAIYSANGAGAPENEFKSVSLVALIANPEKYDGHYVLVHGIASIDIKNGINALYLTREDKIAGNGKNAAFLFLAPSLKKADLLNNKFVALRGRFHADINGHLDSFSGSISDVDVISPVKTGIR